MDLPAFLLSKNVFFRVHRNAPVSCFFSRPFELDRLAVTPNQLARDLSGGSYPIALRDLAFQLCFPSLRWDFASCLSCLATCFGNPLRNFFSPVLP